MGHMSYPSFDNFGRVYKKSWPRKSLMLSGTWDWGNMNCKPKTSKSERPRQNTKKAGRTSTACYTIRASFTSRKLSGQSSSAGTRTIYQQAILELTREIFSRKYYWPTLHRVVDDYVRGCDVCLASKTVRHKLYGNIQSLPVPTHHWKNLSMDFVSGLPILTD